MIETWVTDLLADPISKLPSTPDKIGISRFKDRHIFHPTYAALQKIVIENGLVIDDVYWQPQWKDTVCYMVCRKAAEAVEPSTQLRDLALTSADL